MKTTFILVARLFFFGKKMFQKKISSGSMQCHVICLWNPPNDLCCGSFLDQPTAYNGLIHELKQYQNQKAIIFGRQNVTRKASINRSEFSWGPPRCSRWEQLPRELGWFCLEKRELLRGEPRAAPSAHEEVIEETEPGSSQLCLVGGWDSKNKMEKREIQVGYKEDLCPHEDSWALEQVAQQGQTVSILEVFQAPWVCTPGYPLGTTLSNLSDLWADPALSRMLG